MPPFRPPRLADVDEEPPKFSCRDNVGAHPSLASARGGR
jgi:hypothetical protein